MAIGAQEKRDVNQTTEVAMPDSGLPLFKQYEGVIGHPLKKLPKPVPITETGGEWFWSWTPEQVGLFLADWDSQLYVAHPTLCELAYTPDPGGGGCLYERFCKPEIQAAIKKVQIMYHKPLSAVKTIPKGNFSVDLRSAPPNMRPTKFTIGDLTFSGLVTGIDGKLRDQLAYMHSRWAAEGYRIMQAMDHGTQDTGEVGR